VTSRAASSTTQIEQLFAAALSCCVFLILGLDGGAWLPRAWRLSTVAFLALASAAVVARQRITVDRAERAYAAGFVLLAGWTAGSAAWSDVSGTSLLEGERTLLYAAGVAMLLLVVTPLAVRALLAGAVAGITGVCGYGLVDYLASGRPKNPFEGRLLFQPFGYANGFGFYAALAIVLAGGLALTGRRTWERLVALAPLAVLAPTLYFTGSRGGVVVVVTGGVSLLCLRSGIPHIRLVLAVALAVVVVGGVAVASTASALTTPTVGENRPRYWRAAWHEYGQHPVLGSGAGTYYIYWLRYRRIASFTRDAHNLYLETLAELGPLGLALVLGTLALPFAALRGRNDAAVVVPASGYIAFLVHAAIEWDWEQPAVTLAGVMCGAAIVVAARSEHAPALSARTRLLVLVGAVALAALSLERLAHGPRLPFIA
jgi:hypothetical protein